MVEEARFGSLEAANTFREWLEENEFASALSSEDNRNEKTVRLVDHAPPEVVDELFIRAEASRDAEEERVAPQRELSDEEWEWAQSRGATPQDRFRLQAIKGVFHAEGITDWTNHIGVDATVDEARETARNLREGGRFSPGGAGGRDIQEEEQARRGPSDAKRALAERETRIINKMQDLIDEYGVEQVAYAMAGEPALTDEALLETVGDMQQDFPGADEVMIGVIRDEVGAVFETLQTDLEIVSKEHIETLREQARSRDIDQETKDQVRERLEGAFGMRFDSIEDAVERLQERMARGRGPAPRSAQITARMTSGGPHIRLETNQREILQYEENVKREVRRQINLDNLGTIRVTLGQVRVEDGQLAEIDLEPGRERLGGRDEEALEAESAVEQEMLDFADLLEGITDEGQGGGEGEEGATD